MSLAYRNRKKAIKRWKKENPDKLKHGSITKQDFWLLQLDWERAVIGPPIGALEDFMRKA